MSPVEPFDEDFPSQPQEAEQGPVVPEMTSSLDLDREVKTTSPTKHSEIKERMTLPILSKCVIIIIIR